MLLLTILAAIAGLLYNSWPLGYILNPAAAHAGLASELEALHQPYNWFFIGCDVLCGLLILLVIGLIWRRADNRKDGARLHAPLWGVAAFAIGTIIDALLPMSCIPSVQTCPSFTVDHVLLAHGIFSIGAGLALFVSLLLFWLRERRDRWLGLLLAGYTFFGFISLHDAFQSKPSNASQHYYLLLCAVWLVLIPYALEQYFNRKNRGL